MPNHPINAPKKKLKNVLERIRKAEASAGAPAGLIHSNTLFSFLAEASASYPSVKQARMSHGLVGLDES